MSDLWFEYDEQPQKVVPQSSSGKKPLELNIDPDWLLRMAEKEDNGIISVGGLITRMGILIDVPLEQEEEGFDGGPPEAGE